MILAGDMGGTKTLLGLFEWDGQRLSCVRRMAYASREHGEAASMIRDFAGNAGGIEYACFGVAGPVVDDRCRATNLPWIVDAAALSRVVGGTRVKIVNDLVATAHGLDMLAPDELIVLQEGTQQKGNRALIAAGTGLGEAMLFWDGQRHVPCPSEGGHTDFGPRDDWEIDLLTYMKGRFGHVSYERILCGSGISELYDFLVSRGRMPSPEVAESLRRIDDRSPRISRAGMEKACPVCDEVVARFVSMYGAEAGNLALKSLAVGGVFVGGGIAPKLRSRFEEGAFIRAFCDKGRFRSLLEKIPVYLVLNPATALLGAARHAVDLMTGG